MVEVALALGIVGGILIPLLGLMSMGFTTLKDANTDVRAQLIAQKIIGAAQMLPYGQLEDRQYHLDNEGNPVAAAGAVYNAEVKVWKTPADNFLGSPNAARISVTITGSAVQNTPRIYSATIANLGT